MGSLQRRPRNGRRIIKGRPQKCVFCGKVLQNYFSLEMHMNSHTRERPWQCSYCDATFMSYNVLIVHRNNIHLGKKFKCNLCHRLFNIASHLYTHRKRVHPYMEKVPGRKKMKNGQGMKIFKSSRGGKRGRPRKDTANAHDTIKVITEEEEEEEEEEERRKTVEIESNPGTPLMTVNVRSQDAVVVSKLKLPVIKIQRLPDGVWKQKMVTTSTNSNTSSQFETEDESEGDDTYEMETGLEEPESSLDEFHPEVKFASTPPPPPIYQFVTAAPPTDPLLPHQIPPLPPFNLAFPPFPFKLHNVTVPDNTGYYIGNTHQQPHPQSCWDTSFFLHLNRYKPEDSSCHSDSDTPKSEDSCQSPIRSTSSYQYVSKFCLKRKLVLRKQRPPKESTKKKKAQLSKPVSIGKTDEASTTKVEKEELIEETETGVFTCKECGKEFQIKWNLLTHLMTHTGEKPFGCCFCDMRFRQKAHMIKHIASIHRFQDEKKPVKGKGKICEKEDLSCGFCGEVFEIKVNLIKHISALHGNKLAESV